MLFPCDHHVHLNSISPDGRWLTYTDYHPIRGGDLWLAELASPGKRKPVLQRSFNEWGAQFSPDGNWIVCVSNESGRDEICVMAFPSFDRKRQISTEGGTEPVWSRTGSEIFYREGDNMMAVPVVTQPTFNAAKPGRLFEGRYDRGLTLGHTNYDVAPDAGRFLMLKAGEKEATPAHLNLVLSWFEDLGWSGSGARNS